MLNNTDLNENQTNKASFRKRAVYLLPNLFTTASIFLAFFCMTIAAKGENFELAAYCIVVAAFMDGIDGKVARLTGTTSEFGIQYDSLADSVAFGVAPAFLFWSWSLHSFERFGVGIAFIFLACAALRLARFNVAANAESPQKKFFVGLPSPTAGCTLVTFILFSSYLPFTPYILPPLLCVGVALLMVSRVRYFSFKEFEWGKQHPFYVLIMALFVFILIFARPDFFMFFFLITYILSGLIYTFVYVPLRAKKLRQQHKPMNNN